MQLDTEIEGYFAIDTCHDALWIFLSWYKINFTISYPSVLFRVYKESKEQEHSGQLTTSDGKLAKPENRLFAGCGQKGEGRLAPSSYPTIQPFIQPSYPIHVIYTYSYIQPSSPNYPTNIPPKHLD